MTNAGLSNETAADALKKSIKEAADYKYALEESCIVAITDQKGIINYANNNFCKISKYSREELIGQDHRIINSGFHSKEFIRDMWVTIANGKIWRGEVKNRAKDNSYYWVDATIVPFLDERGKPYQYVAIRADITGRKQAEEEQRLIQEKLLFHIEHTPLGFIEFDSEMRLKSISNKAREILGWKLTEHVSNDLNVYCLIYEEDWDWLNIALNDLITGKSTRNVLRVRNLTKDMRIIWCEWFISVMKSDAGTTFMTQIHDVTENKIFEERLETNDRSLKEAQSIGHIGNWEIDLLNKTEFWSDELYQILGFEKTSVPSTELFLSVIHPDDLKTYLAIFDKIEDNSIDYRLLLKNGSVKYVFSKWRFEFNDDNVPLRMFGILQDITGRKLAEVERTKLVSDLIVRNTELEQFAYIISHNLRAPVANIIGASSALEDPDLTEEDKGILGKGINTAVKKLDEVVKDLNQILQLRDEITGFKEIVDFSELVNDIKISISNLIFEGDVEIKFDFKAINEYLTLKPYMYSVFYNLISNSVKYRKKDIHCIIEINSRIVNNKIELSFKDNGMGINLQKNGAQVFGLYKRFHADVEGKGMGLFMVKTQVETLGGKISIKSEENKGTEFLIELEI